jgi:hypothetical protein
VCTERRLFIEELEQRATPSLNCGTNFFDDPGVLGIRGCDDTELAAAEVAVYHNGSFVDNYHFTELYDFDGAGFPLTYVDYVATDFFRVTYQNGDGTGGLFGTSGVGTFSYRDSAGLHYVPTVNRADVNTGGPGRVETVIVGQFGNTATVTSERRVPDPTVQNTTVDVSTSITINEDILLDGAQVGNDAFRAFTLSSMFACPTAYDANVLRFEDATGTVREVPLHDGTTRDQHLLSTPVEFGSWLELVKTPGSTFNQGSPTIRMDLVEISGYTGRLGIQGFLSANTALDPTTQDSLTVWMELLDIPQTIPSGTVISVQLRITAVPPAPRLSGDLLYVWRDPFPTRDGTPVSVVESARLASFARSEQIGVILYDAFGDGSCGQDSGIQFDTSTTPACSGSGDTVASVIETLHENGLGVRALYTDVSRISDVLAYNDRVGPQQRFDGIHLNLEDVFGGGRPNEPTTADDLAIYQDAVEAAAGLPVYASISHHWGADPEDPLIFFNGAIKPAYQHIIDITAGVDVQTVWDEATEIVRRAVDEVNYARSVGKKAVITIETYDVVQNIPGLTDDNTFFEEGAAEMRAQLARIPGLGIDEPSFAFHFYRQAFGSAELSGWQDVTNAMMAVARPNATGGLVFSLDSNGNRQFDPGVDAVFNFGLASDLIIVGDWTGDGISKLGVARPNATGGLVFSLDSNGNLGYDPGVDTVFNFGLATDTVVTGDWDGQCVTNLGASRSNTTGGLVFSLDSNGNRQFDPEIDAVFNFGLVGDRIVVGDWMGSGIVSLGVARPNATGGLVFSLDSNGNRQFDPGVDAVFNFGLASDLIIVGDWTGDGISKLGVARPNATGGLVFSLDSNGNLRYDPGVDAVFNFGLATDTAVVGAWSQAIMLAASATVGTDNIVALSPVASEPLINATITSWPAAGATGDHVAALFSTAISVVESSGSFPALTLQCVIDLDADAAGYSWFVGSIPTLDEEFEWLDDEGWLADTQASERIDLLTVLAHELGHALGLDHSQDPDDLMSARLEPGVRRLPTAQAIDALLASELFDDLLGP